MNEEITGIINSFDIKGTPVSASAITDGNINRTYRIEVEDGGKIKKYLLQRINTFVFRNPDELMQNIFAVTGFLKEKIRKNGGDESRETLSFIKTKDGKQYYKTEGNDCWRCYVFVDDAYALNSIDNAGIFYKAGKAFGNFQNLLSDFPSETLFETIPDFHNTEKRYENLEKSIENNKANRVGEVKEEIDFIRKRKDDTSRLTKLMGTGELPLRVTHNDTKLNNILFDKKTNEGICVIDLDTVMPGLSLYDFGDCVRYGASTAKEDERDLSKVSIDLELFEAYSKGYLSSVGDTLTKKEKELLAFSVKLLSLELAIRFLTDYLDGDEYFKINYPDHNLVRTRVQLKLVEDIENKLGEMEEIIKKCSE
jgi:Ser/Thr protein kinase RdoA (MazF antagonist)